MADRETGPSPSESGSYIGTPAEASTHASHGNSRAAWISVSVVMLGALIMSVSVLLGSVAVFVVGAVVVVLGAVAAKVLTAMGFGNSEPHAGTDAT